MSGERKVLLLTGASRGIGHATVQRFSDAGWRIITCSRDAVPAECKRDPNWTHHITADLGDPADLERFVAEAGDLLDGAARTRSSTMPGCRRRRRPTSGSACLNGDIDDWHRVFQLNFFVPLILSRAFAAALARGKGAIVNVTSIAGHAVHPVRRLGLFDLEGGVVGADARDGGRVRRGSGCASTRWRRARSRPRCCRPRPRC